ncbi:hypothetical protein CXF79_09385 [Colwellia sp. Bg11-28]|nr:hypothetical protein CXF79_09385 [Colwellia sp. Bg11-28]
MHFKKLPYDIKIIDLICEDCIDVDLFVELPKSYFESWDNFPNTGRQSNQCEKNDIGDAGYYNLIIRLDDETSLSELSHPYDAQLNESFKKRFGVQPPLKLIKCDHPNGRSFYPNEAYMAYWKAYVILEAANECLFIDRYMAKEEGSLLFKDKVRSVNQKWLSQYASIFDAISHYRTLISQFNHLEKLFTTTHGELSQHLLNRANITASELNSGLGSLLTLHLDWSRKLNNNGMTAFNFALKSLKRDIYFLFEWLCGLSYTEEDLFKQWANSNGQAASHSQLKDVLDFEEIHFKLIFERYTPIYCQDNSKWFNLDGVAETYDQLNEYQSFEPWISSFSDLHKSINKKSDITFVQPRLLDTLLVMTIRTEVLIRTMLLNLSGKQEPDDFYVVLRELSAFVKDDASKTVLIAVGDNRDLTKLQDRPESVFNKIETSIIGKKWSNKQKHFFKVIQKFITSRNYFAHHYYKDHEFKTHTNKFCGEVVTSCLQTILFINDSKLK